MRTIKRFIGVFLLGGLLAAATVQAATNVPADGKAAQTRLRKAAKKAHKAAAHRGKNYKAKYRKAAK